MGIIRHRCYVQGYVRKLAIYLLDISSESGSPSSLALLQRCTLELTGFFVCYWCCNPQHVATLHSLNMQTGLPFEESPPEDLHEDLLVGNACICKVHALAWSKANACRWQMKSVRSTAQHLYLYSQQPSTHSHRLHCRMVEGAEDHMFACLTLIVVHL